MILEGKVWKSGPQWLIEVPVLDLATQGKSKKVAYAMLKDAIKLLLGHKHFSLKIRPLAKPHFLLECKDDTELLALILKRQRVKHDLSLSEMAKRLKVRSKNSYAQYEQGRSQPSLSKLQEFLTAMNSGIRLSLGLVEG